MLLALDRATVRYYDVDGRLHVEISNISKANICGYRGNEIPGWESLGLDPEQIYQLLRDPGELAQAASTFNNIPLLSRHVPVTADDHHPDLVIGSTGTDAEFEAPYLKNSLVIWARAAIDGVEDKTQREISSAYRYRLDLTPGIYEGQAYDGVMRDIVGNHCAVIETGRVGPDVVVGDSKPAHPEAIAFDFSPFTHMKDCHMASKFSRKAAVAHGALITFLAPKLAQDAQIDLAPAFKGVTSKNFSDKKTAIVKAVEDLTSGKLAQDASIEGLLDLLGSIDKIKLANDEDLPKPGAGSETSTVAEDDDDEDEKKKKVAEDEDDEDDKGKKPKIGEDEDDDKKDGDKVTKTAMDAAIVAAVKQANRNHADIRNAETAVRPYVGELAMAHDSAEGVYRTALKILKVEDHDTIHASALPTILKMQPLPGAKPNKSVSVAMDAKGAASYAERFPMAGRIGQA